MHRIFRKEKDRAVYNWHEYCAHGLVATTHYVCANAWNSEKFEC